MEARPRLIEIYETEGGKAPFEIWFNDLRDAKAKKKINARIARARAGNFGDSKAVGEGVVELRVDYGPGFRVYFGRYGDTVVVLLCGGDKRTQDKDITLAKEYWKKYKERKKEVKDDS